MGSFSSSSSREKKVSSSTKPLGFTSPLGSVSTSKKGVVSFSPDEQTLGVYRNATGRLNDTLNQLPTSFSLNDMYNNPFYDTTAQLFQAPIDRQYRQQQQDLDNNLNARNQVGSSYDALQHNYLNQNHDYNSNQGRLQARQASADAYNQNINNLLNTLSGLNNTQSNESNIMYQPLHMAIGMQSAQSPLQTTMAQYQANQPTSYENLMKFYDTNINALATGAKALFGH